MAWQIEFQIQALKELRRLDAPHRERIIRYLKDRVASSDNPRELAQALSGNEFAGLYRFRVGDYRLIAVIEDQEVLILIVRIGHRREVYR